MGKVSVSMEAKGLIQSLEGKQVPQTREGGQAGPCRLECGLRLKLPLHSSSGHGHCGAKAQKYRALNL